MKPSLFHFEGGPADGSHLTDGHRFVDAQGWPPSRFFVKHDPSKGGPQGFIGRMTPFEGATEYWLAEWGDSQCIYRSQGLEIDTLQREELGYA